MKHPRKRDGEGYCEMGQSVKDILYRMRTGDYRCSQCDDMCDCPNTDKIIKRFAREIDTAHRSEMRDKRKLCAEVKRITKIEELLTSENYRLHNEIAEQSAVNTSLRSLVKELADVLDDNPCFNCASCGEPCERCSDRENVCELVANGEGGVQVKTNLIGLRKLYERLNWFGLWSIDDHNLTNYEAHIFVDRAIAAGYTFDVDVPDDLIREWIGLPKKESEVSK